MQAELDRIDYYLSTGSIWLCPMFCMLGRELIRIAILWEHPPPPTSYPAPSQVPLSSQL